MTSITSGTNAVASNPTVGQREGEVSGQTVLPQAAVAMSGGGPYVPPMVVGMGMHCGVNANQANQILPQQYHHYYQNASSNFSTVASNRQTYNGTQQSQIYQCPTQQRTATVSTSGYQSPATPIVGAQSQMAANSFRGNIPQSTSQQSYYSVQQPQNEHNQSTQSNLPAAKIELSQSPASNANSNGGYVNMWPQYNSSTSGAPSGTSSQTNSTSLPYSSGTQNTSTAQSSFQPGYQPVVSNNRSVSSSSVLPNSSAVNGEFPIASSGTFTQQRVSSEPNETSLPVPSTPATDNLAKTELCQGKQAAELSIKEDVDPDCVKDAQVEDNLAEEEVSEDSEKPVDNKESVAAEKSRPSSPTNASPPPVAQSTPFQQNQEQDQTNQTANNIPATMTFGDAIGALVTERALSESPSPRTSPHPMHESPSGSPATSNSSGQSLALSGTPMIMPMANAAPLSPECGEGGPMDCSAANEDGNGGMAFPGGPHGPMTSSSSVSGSGVAGAGEDSNEGSGSGNSKCAFNNYEHVCQFCDYTSRTEGRLKRHIKDFHSEVPPSNYSGSTKVVRSGRPKNYRCKQCSFTATNKVDFWEHSRAHIKEDKLLQCPKCPFVTEYKHHLEYHLRNHFGSKPFKCSKCNYSCVNKSMLNSHMKSHTNIYQYRCADCSYATKYCHSLKLHLRKYDHHASNLMTADGSLVVDEKGEHSQSGTNDPGTPNAVPLSMSLFGPGPNGEDADMKNDGNGENDEHEDGDHKPNSGPNVLETNGLTNGTPLSRLPLSFPGIQDSPAGWNGAENANVAANARVIPPQMASAMSRLVSGEGAQDPAALASLMGAYYSMMGPQAGSQQGSMAAMCAAPVPGNGQQATMIKCNTCGFLAPSWPLIMQHVFKVHAAEHNDLFRAFGVSPEVLSDLNKCMVPGQFPASGMPPAVAAMLAGQLPPGVQIPGVVQQQNQPPSNKRRGSHTTSTGSPMAAQNAAALSQFLASASQTAGNGRPPGSQAPWPLDLTKSGGSGSGSGSYRDSRSRSSPSLGMNGGGSGSSVSRSTDTPASSSNDAPLTGADGTNGLEILCRRSSDIMGADHPSSPASGESGSGSGSGTNGDANGRRRSRKGKAVKLSAMRQGQSLGGGSEGDGEGVTSGSSAAGGEVVKNGWTEQYAERIDDWAVQSHLEATRQSQSGDQTTGSRRQSSSTGSNPAGVPVVARQSARAATGSGPQFECNHCEMAFRDVVMYTIHMGYHGFLDPFKCNMCGSACRDKVDFFLHIARQAHS